MDWNTLLHPACLCQLSWPLLTPELAACCLLPVWWHLQGLCLDRGSGDIPAPRAHTCCTAHPGTWGLWPQVRKSHDRTWSVQRAELKSCLCQTGPPISPNSALADRAFCHLVPKVLQQFGTNPMPLSRLWLISKCRQC